MWPWWIVLIASGAGFVVGGVTALALVVLAFEDLGSGVDSATLRLHREIDRLQEHVDKTPAGEQS